MYVDLKISRVKSFMNVVHVSNRIWQVLRRRALSEHAKFCFIISAMFTLAVLMTRYEILVSREGANLLLSGTVNLPLKKKLTH